jgi:hypothetical protein
MRVDPIQLAEIAQPKLTSTQELEKILDDIQAKQREREGAGEGEKVGGE